MRSHASHALCGRREAGRFSFVRKAKEGEKELSTQNATGVKAKFDPLEDIYSIDEKAVLKAMEINPAIKRTISYAWPEAQYQLIARVANKENRKMRNMLFHMVEFYIKANKLEEKYPLPIKK